MKCVYCNRKSIARNMCKNHYVQWHTNGDVFIDRAKGTKKEKICCVSECKETIYAKGYCRNHYANFVRYDNPLGKYGGKTCIVKGCKVKVHSDNDLNMCHRHHYRFVHNLPLNSKASNNGPRNGNWKGGVYMYKNSYEMKKNKKLRVEMVKGKCESCGKNGSMIKHIDGNLNNHKLSNLRLFCRKCWHKR